MVEALKMSLARSGRGVFLGARNKEEIRVTSLSFYTKRKNLKK